MALADIAVELAGATGARWRMELLETADGIVGPERHVQREPDVDGRGADRARAPRRRPARRIAVLGDMRELGEHHDDAHREIGERAAALGSIWSSGSARAAQAISDAAGRGGVRVAHAADAPTRRAARSSAFVAPGDAVLVKGSRAVGLERVVDGCSRRRAACGR